MGRGPFYEDHIHTYRVGTGCAMDYAGKYTVDVFSIYRWRSSMLSYAPYFKT
jgi:hypothetical protein